MKDIYGNYITGLNPYPLPNQPYLTTTYGAGAPSGNPVQGQRTYINTTSGATYANVNGAWVLVTSAVPVGTVS